MDSGFGARRSNFQAEELATPGNDKGQEHRNADLLLHFQWQATRLRSRKSSLQRYESKLRRAG